MSNKDYSTELPTILNNMMDVFYRTDAEGNVVMVTPSITEMLGYEVDELLGKPVASLYEHPEQRRGVLELVEQNGGRYKGAEVRLVHKDGGRVWVSSNVQFYYDDEGKFAGIEGMVRDITRHKITEENLRRSEQKFRTIIDHMLDIYYRTDAEGKLIMASPSCEELLGYKPEELMGKRLTDLYVDPGVRDEFMQKMIDQGGKYYGFENSLRRKDGRTIWAVASSQFYFDEEGNIAGVEGLVRDISKRKEMEDALRESESKLRAIFENMMDTYIRTDREGNVEMVSPSVEKLLGYRPDELIGRRLRDFYSIPDSRETLIQLLEENGGHYYGYEIQVRHKDGRHLWVLINVQFHYDEEGEVAGLEALGRNISEIKRVEEALLQAKEEAEAANSAKTEFLSNMSHELRTPLNAILGFSSLLVNYSKDPLPDKVTEFLRNIHDAGTHLSSLINQVLDLAKIESGSASVELVPTRLDEIINDSVRLMRPLAVKYKVHLEYDIDSCKFEGRALYAMLDPLRMRQVMINLISNAIKYNVENGHTKIVCTVDGDSVEVSIEDSGSGIPLERQANIFQPFTRAHDDEEVEGSGIGLAVTKKNLELMDSEIQFTSQPGEGSRFWFVLPLAEAPSSDAHPEGGLMELPQQPLGVSVLYVEDNPIGMRLMEEVLSTLPGVTFYQATTGEEGYRVAVEQHPDLIIMDINLPDISGFDVLQRLQQVDDHDFQVVALSASALEEDVQRGLQAGFLRYLRKPFEPDEIIRLLTELSEQKDPVTRQTLRSV